MQLIDTHAHLNFEAFNGDWRQVMKQCLANQVKVINVGSQLETSQKAIQIAEEFKDDAFAAVGLHAVHCLNEEFSYQEYKKLAQNPKVVAIGETGLDYYHLWADSGEEEQAVKQKQKEVFNQHLDLALELGLPAIIHCRDAYEEMISVLKGRPKNPHGVIHCFLADQKIADEFLNLGFSLSFTGIITFTDDQGLLNLIKELPLEKMMVETDSPYLAPLPFRGQRGEPIQVRYVAQRIANLRGTDLEIVAEATLANAKNLFKLT